MDITVILERSGTLGQRKTKGILAKQKRQLLHHLVYVSRVVASIFFINGLPN